MTILNWTYNALTSALQNWLDDTDPDWVNTITLPQIVWLGEAKVTEDLDLTLFDSSANVTLPFLAPTATSTLVARPAGIIVTDSMGFLQPAGSTDPGKFVPVELRSVEWIQDYLDPLVTGSPLYYAESDVVNYIVAPYPDQAYTLTSYGIYAPVSLNDVNPASGSTWLGTNVANVLLEACLMEASKLLKNEGKRKIQEAVYNAKLGPIKLRLRALRRSTLEDPRAVGGQAAEGQLPSSAPAPGPMGNALTRQ
jgi:hypothetical protein